MWLYRKKPKLDQYSCSKTKTQELLEKQKVITEDFLSVVNKFTNKEKITHHEW